MHVIAQRNLSKRIRLLSLQKNNVKVAIPEWEGWRLKSCFSNAQNIELVTAKLVFQFQQLLWLLGLKWQSDDGWTLTLHLNSGSIFENTLAAYADCEYFVTIVLETLVFCICSHLKHCIKFSTFKYARIWIAMIWLQHLNLVDCYIVQLCLLCNLGIKHMS